MCVGFGLGVVCQNPGLATSNRSVRNTFTGVAEQWRAKTRKLGVLLKKQRTMICVSLINYVLLSCAPTSEASRFECNTTAIQQFGTRRYNVQAEPAYATRFLGG